MPSHQWKSEVWECDYDGHNAHQITHTNSYCVTPSYLIPKPGFNSGSFFYVSYVTGIPKIYIASLRDGNGRRFSYLGGNQLHPSISWQRDAITFVSDVGGNPDIYVQAFSPSVGSMGKPRQVFTSTGAQGSPVFSPNGKYIAFVSNMDGTARIYIIPRSGKGKASLLTKSYRDNTSPSWSPDGSKLVYSAKVDGIRQICCYDFRSEEEKQLTYSNVNKENPSWALDSLHIVFNSADISSCHLYIMNLNQLEPMKISSGKEEHRFPVWEPKILLDN